ncbi:MAG: RES family NAD+ phosphorylase [Blastocatellia bacterium]
MNLWACGQLSTSPETQTWYRAIQPQFWTTALQTSQTTTFPTRFNEGANAHPQFEILYLAEDHQLALFEAQALLGSPLTPGSIVPQPRKAWVILNVQVVLQAVADLTQVTSQNIVGTTAQELTGDWRGYTLRSPSTSISQPTGTAPTQALGAQLHAVPGLEGFLTLSAKIPYGRVLAVFPDKLRSGSTVEFVNTASSDTHRIAGADPL